MKVEMLNKIKIIWMACFKVLHSYYINGKVNMTGNYLNNEMDGQWKRYYETSELKEVVRRQ
jgi:predicted nucleic-acid-binding Zn-ribbon protein